MPSNIASIACAGLLAVAATQALAAPAPSLEIASQGYIFAGGHYVDGPDGKYMSGQAYVEYQIPAKRTHPFPIVMIHGGGQNGSNFTGTPDGRDGSVTLHADASLRAGLFDGSEHAEMALVPGRLSYVHVARGSVVANGHKLAAGDAALLRDETTLALSDGRDAEVLVFDLAP